MLTLFKSDTICPLNELKDLAAAQIKRLPEKIAPIGDCIKILRYEWPCEPVNILAWLHNQKLKTKIYWSNRNGQFEIGGIGICDKIKKGGLIDYKELFTYMEDRLSADNPHLRYYGGMSFNHQSNGKEWEDFDSYQFIIPQFEFTSNNGQTSFAFNISVNDINEQIVASILNTLTQIDFSPRTTYRKVPKILSRSDLPNKQEWRDIFKNIQNNNGTLLHKKIVLARKSVFDFDVAIRSNALLKHLKDRTPECFHFCFQVSDSHAFLGATPERLYKREGQTIKTEAIAGTRPRGQNDNDDKILEDQLRSSRKDIREHQFVVDAIQTSLEPLCQTLTSDKDFSLRKLKGSQHLATRFEGRLDHDITDEQILASLHPTPAVAGTPTPSAIETIKEVEPFSRGWYTGPIGYIGYNEAEFAVAIRCGLVHNHQLSLYAGAGIVNGSTASGEWDEIENKISNFMRVFEKES